MFEIMFKMILNIITLVDNFTNSLFLLIIIRSGLLAGIR